MKARKRRPEGWGEMLLWLALLALLVLLLTGEARHPTPEPPTAQERAAQFAAQERYYEALELYGDIEGALEAAKVVYEMEEVVGDGT